MIRFAEISDLDACVEMGVEFTKMAGFTPGEGKISTTMTGLIDSDSLIVFGLPAIGMVAGIIYEHFFNNEKVAQELFWWVKPSARGGIGKQLLTAFEDWAIQQGADKVLMISLEKNDVSGIYEKRGYTPLEHTYERLL